MYRTGSTIYTPEELNVSTDFAHLEWYVLYTRTEPEL